MKTKLFIFLCFFGVLAANAQVDSLDRKSENGKVKTESVEVDSLGVTRKQYNLNYSHRSFSAALPIAAVGLAVIPADGYVRDYTQENLKGFQSVFDDYLQYTPWAAHAVMGLCGVKGVSKNRWQVLTADALAAVMMATMVNGLKYSINRTRPNGDNASFPSGHTATAFTGATLLAHEYGCRSVWIPIAGYTVATASGVMRILNNRHYVSDVVVGAAVGILSAELAYWATDAIFNDRKLQKSHRKTMRNNIANNY